MSHFCVIFFFLPRLSGFGNGFVQVGFFQLLRPTVLIFFSSLGFPDLETGSCRWDSSNCGGVLFLRGVLPTVGFFFLLPSSSRLSGFGNRVVQGGVSSLGFPDLETGFMQGGGAVIRRGGVDPLNFVIDIAPSPLCHRSFIGSFGFPDLETGCCICYTQGGSMQ